jgi:hypothetical protein
MFITDAIDAARDICSKLVYISHAPRKYIPTHDYDSLELGTSLVTRAVEDDPGTIDGSV